MSLIAERMTGLQNANILLAITITVTGNEGNSILLSKSTLGLRPTHTLCKYRKFFL